MKVIIKKTNEVKEVSFGYAVNYLIPQDLAVRATSKELKALKEAARLKIKKKEEKGEEDKALAQKLADKKLIVKAKIQGRSKKKIFGRVTKKDIIKLLKADPKKVKVVLKEPIKKLGKHKVELQIGSQKVFIKVEVEKEK